MSKRVNAFRGSRSLNRNAQMHAATSAGFEQLESRSMLSGDSVVNSTGFAPKQWRGGSIQYVRQDSWMISFYGSQSVQQAEARVRLVATALGVQPQSIIAVPNGRQARLETRGAITEASVDQVISQFPFLRAINPERGYATSLTPNDPNLNLQWGHRNTGQAIPGGNAGTTVGLVGADVKSQLAWDTTTGSDRVVIAVLDTGIDFSHPDLASNIYRNPREIPFNGIDDDTNGFIDDVSGFDFAAGDGTQFATDNNPQDGQGHGTAVAGVIGAVGGNSIGVTGVAWRVSLLPIKIFPDADGGLASGLSIALAYDYVITLKNAGVNIVALNASYGALSQSSIFDAGEDAEIQQVTNAGILFVAAAGNESNDNDGIIRGYPASYPNPQIISVAATTNQDELAGFSNFGRTSVDLGAPGQGIYTTSNGGGYEYIDGTSFAAPFTTGVIALMAAANRFATPAELRAALLASTDPVAGLANSTVTGGRLNANRAVQAIAIPGPVVTGISPGTQAATVTQAQITFSKPIAAGSFDRTRIELRRANGAPTFNGSEIDVSLAGAQITLSPDGRLVTIVFAGGPLPRDLYRLILRSPGFRDSAGNFLNGNTTTGRDEIYDFTVVPFRGVLEPNDVIGTASPLVLNTSGVADLTDLVIGDGANLTTDVDLFRVFVSGPSLITVQVTGRSLAGQRRLDTVARLFDPNGTQLAINDNFDGLNSRIQYFVPAAGQYFIGISAFPNTGYDPLVEGSGNPGDTGGSYDLRVSAFVPPQDLTTYSNSTTVAIPEVGTISSTIFVPDGRTITDIGVRINLSHSSVADLSITLTAPTGQVVQLFNRRGAPGANLTGTVFTNSGTGSALASGTAPFTGRFRPEQSLAAFTNIPAVGTWQLTITDSRPLDQGSLTNWAVDLTLANDAFGIRELNDTQILSTDTGISGRGAATFDGLIGDGAFGLRDVDLYRFTAEAGTTLTATSSVTDGSVVKSIMRLFDSSGAEVRADRRKATSDNSINFVIAAAGLYYIGISGGSNDPSPSVLGNDNYTIGNGGSGTPTDSTGRYSLTISVAGGISENSIVATGNIVRAGLSSVGTFGASSTGLGFGSGFDFLGATGSGLSYFAGTADGTIFRNVSDRSQVDLPLTVSTESDFNNRRAIVTGQYRSLGVSRTLSFGVRDGFIAVDVVLTNRSSLVINDIAWMEGFDPNPSTTGGLGSRITTNNSRNVTSPTTGPVLATAVGSAGQTIGLAAAAGTYNVVTSFNAPGRDRDPLAVLSSPTDPDASNADVGVAGDREVTIAFSIGNLGPSQAARFRYFILMGNSLGAVNTQFTTLTAGTGTGHLVSNPQSLSLPSSSLPYVVYYPEGFANNRAATFLPILNAQSQSVRVVVIAHYEDSRFASDVLFDSVTDNASTAGLVPATVRGGITLTTPSLYAGGTSTRVASQITGRPGVRKDTPYAVEVRSSLPVGAVFSHYDANISTGQSAISELSSTWTFAEGQKGAGIADYVVLFNPGDSTIKVSMTVFPLSGNGQQFTITGVLAPNKRGGWSIKDIPQIRDGTFGIRVDADTPIVAALTHYNTNLNNGRGAGYATVGLPGLGSTSGGTGQGQTGQTGPGVSDERVSLFNPTDAAATVTLNFAFSSGNAFRQSIVVPARQYRSVNVSSLPGFPSGQAFGVTYTSTQPVAVSLPSFSTAGASGATLVNRASTQWLFGEGFRPLTSSSASDFLRVYNPSNAETTVEITLSFNDGTSELFRRTIPSKATANYNLFDFVTGYRATIGTSPGVGSFFGTRLTSSIPVVAFMGHFDAALQGGFGITGTPIGGTLQVS